MSGVTAVRFQSGGALREGALYVERPADSELPEALLRGEFCYVLAPRQIGKSSLRARAEKQLRKAGIRCVTIDLTRIGTVEVTPEQWYFALVEEVATGLGLPEDPADYWARHGPLSPVHRWSLFLRDEVLARVAEPVVVFLDEIDTLLVLPFSADDFFAAIRAVYNARADDAIYSRLTFCLIGVATPPELMRDAARTPFNIGQWIRLDDFTREEAQTFLPGLSGLGADPHVLLDAVFGWTEGHPFMTQAICEALARQGTNGAAPVPDRVEGVVTETFLRGGRAEVPLFADAEKRLVSHHHAGQLLQLYRHLVSGQQVPADSTSPIHLDLRLTGMAAERREEAGIWLRVRNRIFATVFSRDWVRAEEAARELSDPVARWIASGKHDDYVLRGQQQEAARLWADGRDDLTSEERDFLLAGMAVARREEEEHLKRAHGRAKAQRRAIRRLAILALALTCAVAFAGWQFNLATTAGQKERVARSKADQLARSESSARTVADDARSKAEQSARAAYAAAQREMQAKAAAVAARLKAEEAAQRERGAAEKERGAKRRAEKAEAGLQWANLEERGIRATMLAEQPGKEIEALQLATDTVETSLRQGRPPPEAVEGLTTALTTTRLSQPLGGGEAKFQSEFVSPDGLHVVTAGRDGRLQVWDAHTGKLAATLASKPGKVALATISRGGSRVITVGGEGIASLWDDRTGKRLTTLRGSPGRVTSASFSHSGAYVAIAGNDGVTCIWDTRTGTLSQTLHGHQVSVRCAAFSPDDTRLVTGGDDGTADVWETQTGRLIHPLQGHVGSIRCAAFSPESARIVTAGDDHTARIWEASTGSLLHILSGHSNKVYSATYSPEGARIVTAGADHEVRLWSDEGQLLYTLLGHTDEVISAAFSPEGELITTASKDHTARVWDGRTGRLISTLQGHQGGVNSAVFSGDTHHVVTASQDQTVRLWNLDADLSSVTYPQGSPVLAAAFSPQSTRIVCMNFDGTVVAWEPHTHKRVILGHAGPVRSAAFSSDCGHIVTLGAGPRSPPDAPLMPNRIANPLRDSSAQQDGGAQVWAISDRAVRRLFALPAIRAAGFSADGTRLATVDTHGRVEFRDSRTGRRLNTLTVQGLKGRATSAALSPDGRLVAIGSDDGTARLCLWDARTGRLRTEHPMEHPHVVTAISFSPDGAHMITASSDGLVRLWDTPTGKLLVAFRGHTDVVNSAAFSPDGLRVVTASADGTIKVFPATVQAFLRMAHEVLDPRRR